MPISLVPMSTFEIPRANGSSCYCCCAVTAASDEIKDGNGDPIPDPRRGFHPLGDVNGVFLVPVGILTDQILSPSGEPGTGTFLVSLVPVTHRGPRQQHQRSPPATETKPRPINIV